MSSNKITRPVGCVLGVLLLSAGLLSCGDQAAETDIAQGPEAPAQTFEVSTKQNVQEVQYPEYERQQRVERINALAADATMGARAFETCASCHGAGGFGSRDGQIPRLAGQLKPVIVEKLIEISDGIRHRPEMEPFIAGIDEDGEIAALAAHIAALPDPEDVRQGTGQDLALGKETFERFCASCHEVDGRGNAEGRIPRIAGWDAPGIRRTLVILGADYSEVHETGMSDLVSMMTEAEIDAVADYVSRLTSVAP